MATLYVVERLSVRFWCASSTALDDVVDMDVGLALRAVAEDAQVRRIREQPPHEIEADAVRLPRADDVAEAEGAAVSPNMKQ